ncbi:polysaccharide deacetylase family protein [Paenibacillus tarimensis]|uniref:polysaccharide deacetylase family protein n=1 Tax=Paenibacillus tarimensis TaxID=416012 RepID=UPI001F3110A8|nr:polysaccharide deacetylase family protein [Paenibacillus tarimensis]MCF2945211.1 polysaccharide deacetylase family protein [Paenibacillus tarimensis]
MSSADIIHQVNTEHKAVAFTFDDGPNPVYTPQILDIFHEVSGQATFYMIGEQMLKHPEIVEAVVAEQHEIGNHTYSHPQLTQLKPEAYTDEISRTDFIIKEMTGSSPATFRPPYLDYNEDIGAVCTRFGYSVIGALNGEARDWEMPGVSHIVESTRPHAHSGSMLLFHDGFDDRSQTVEAVRILVAELAAAGYRFVTVSELLRLGQR